MVPISFLLSSYLLPFLFYFVFICCCEPVGLLSVSLCGSLHAAVVHSIPRHIACAQVVKSQWCERGHGDRAGWVCKAYMLLPEGQLLCCLTLYFSLLGRRQSPGRCLLFRTQHSICSEERGGALLSLSFCAFTLPSFCASVAFSLLTVAPGTHPFS